MNKPTYEQYQEGSYTQPGGFEKKMFEAFAEAGQTNQEKLKKLFPHFFGVHKDPHLATGVAYCKGDRSVGIQGQEYTFELHRALLEEEESREFFRKEFQQLYREITEEICWVFFDDEDHEDGSLLSKQIAANKKATEEINQLKSISK